MSNGGFGLSPGASWSEDMDRKRLSLRSARALAVLTQFRLGMDYQDVVASLGLVTQIELALISFFGESVPEPGVEWDAERRHREIERRLARFRWVEREQAKEYSGFKGVWNNLIGRTKVSGKELYQQMLEEADGMLAAMSGGGQDVGAMEEVLKYSGVDHLARGR